MCTVMPSSCRVPAVRQTWAGSLVHSTLRTAGRRFVPVSNHPSRHVHAWWSSRKWATGRGRHVGAAFQCQVRGCTSCVFEQINASNLTSAFQLLLPKTEVREHRVMPVSIGTFCQIMCYRDSGVVSLQQCSKPHYKIRAYRVVLVCIGMNIARTSGSMIMPLKDSDMPH